MLTYQSCGEATIVERGPEVIKEIECSCEHECFSAHKSLNANNRFLKFSPFTPVYLE